MGWKDVPDSQQSERIPGGIYDSLSITRIIRGSKKNNTQFTSNAGDPQIGLIVTDDQAREAMVMVTLSAKAIWKVKSFFLAFEGGEESMDAMDADGVDIFTQFQDELFASKQLCDRKFRGEVRWEKGDKGKDFADVIPFRYKPADAAANTALTTAEPDNADLPFP